MLTVVVAVSRVSGVNPGHFFQRTGASTFTPSVHAGGAWSDSDQHFSPLAGLLVHEIERDRHERGNGPSQLARLTFDILGRLPFQEFEVDVRVIRPGRTIELVEATMSSGGRSVLTTRAWYLTEADSSPVSVIEEAPLPGPESGWERYLTRVWTGGYIHQVEAKQVSEPRPGSSATWITSPTHLIEGEKPIGIAEYVARIDTANGIAVREDPTEWMFPNIDLSVHFFREPESSWTGLDTTVTWGPTGIGLTSTVLHDIHGPVGRAEQSLTIRRQ